MSKYLTVFKTSWEIALVYRVNFVLWRIRSVLQLLLVYFIWWTVLQSQNQIFGYTKASLLTYIMVASLIRAIILPSTPMDVAKHINEGSIINFLVKPLGFIQFFFFRDLADKLFSIFLVAIELFILVLILRPPLIFQFNPEILTMFVLAVILGLLLYFAIAFTIGMLTFWVENVWGPMFLVMIILEGFGGGLFPIDILPKNIADILLLTPFPYFIYFPAKIYLGTLPLDQIIKGFTILSFWVLAFWYLMTRVLARGLRKYSAFGY